MVRLWAALMDVGPPPAPTHARSTTRPIFPPLHPPLPPSSSATVRLSTYLFSYLRLHVDPCLSFRGGKIVEWNSFRIAENLGHGTPAGT